MYHLTVMFGKPSVLRKISNFRKKVVDRMFEKVKRRIVLSENAKLFDTREYLFKTFIAVLIGAYIGSVNDYVSKDMISLLFGMMLTLEPVNMAGIRSGISQIEATLIGAVVTAIVVVILGGYGVLTTAIAITATLYVCMVINWRELMVVAVFTAIYMTQYVQVNALGNASSLETLKLRLIALGTGVLIAFLVNFLFSLIGYRRMVNKRIYFISKELYESSESIRKALEQKDTLKIAGIMATLPKLFNNIDWITGTLADVKKDQQRLKIVYRHFNVDKFMDYTIALRGVTHVTYDLCHRISLEPQQFLDPSFISSYEERLGHFNAVKEAFNNDKEIPIANWREVELPWMNHFSKALEQLNL